MAHNRYTTAIRNATANRGLWMLAGIGIASAGMWNLFGWGAAALLAGALVVIDASNTGN